MKQTATIKIYRYIYYCLFIPLAIYLFIITRKRVGAFGCFDDCFNITAGYFILSGKHIFSDFFYNHQPLAAFISAGIQLITHPQTLYNLILVHRESVFLFGFLSDLFLIYRFGLPGFLFAFIFESSKAYVFGDRFLAESFIVYPLVYLFGLVHHALYRLKISPVDVVLAVISAWFIIWMREPYIPLALFDFGLFIFLNWKYKPFRNALFWFLGLNILTFLLFKPADYIFNLFTVNITTNAGSESGRLLSYPGIIQVISYPFAWFFGGVLNPFRIVDSFIAAIFLICTGIKIRTEHKYTPILVIFLTLWLANIRSTPPGTVYYEAFHTICRFGLGVAITGCLIGDLFLQPKWKKLMRIFTVIIILPVIFLFISPQSYLRDRIDRTAEFNTGYANIYANGLAVKILSRPGQTFFVDSIEELMYWQADRPSPYKYNWFTSVMPSIPVYLRARLEMFRENPPDFYWGGCDGVRIKPPSEITEGDLYTRLNISGKPACLYLKTAIIPTISKTAWEQVLPLGFSL